MCPKLNLIDLELDYDPLPPEHECPGLVFKCSRSAYSSEEYNLVETLKLRLLKRKSCKYLKSCPNCSFWFDLFNEEYDIWKESGIPCYKPFEDGKLYYPAGRTYSTYEGDYDFEWQFEELKESK